MSSTHSHANMPKISVIMPVLNREDTIEKAIQSVLDQQYDNVELIILDGGSKDKTIEIIKRHEQHIAYWHSQHDGSAAVATNIGIGKATGDLVALLMADDFYEPGLFKNIAASFIAHPDADIFTCAGRIVAYDEEAQAYKTLAAFTSPRELELTFYNICFGASAICFRFIKRSLYERIGLYIPFGADKKHMLTNDKEFLLRAVLHDVKDIFVGQVGYTYLAHKESYSFGKHRATSIRHCIEHMYFAQQYLGNRKLSIKHKLLLIYWYNTESAKLLLFRLLDGDWHAASQAGATGIRRYPFIWPVVFCITGCKIIFKQGMRKLRSLFPRQVVSQS